MNSLETCVKCRWWIGFNTANPFYLELQQLEEINDAIGRHIRRANLRLLSSLNLEHCVYNAW